MKTKVPCSRNDEQPMLVVIITGLSGSGKTTALHALEDLGFFSIDNLPVILLPRLLELGVHTTEDISSLAIVVDAREGGFLRDMPQVIETAKQEGHVVHVLFLDAEDDILQMRYRETRRRHPFAETGSVEEGIKMERELVSDLRQISDLVIDTGRMNVHELKAIIQDRYSISGPELSPSLQLLSFGFKYGLPPQADLVFDCRFLPNPYFVPNLREKTGLEDEVAEYVLSDEALDFAGRVEDLLVWLYPLYTRERKSHLSVAVGCTGGRHRSVAITGYLSQRLREMIEGVPVNLRHRDISR